MVLPVVEDVLVKQFGLLVVIANAGIDSIYKLLAGNFNLEGILRHDRLQFL